MVVRSVVVRVVVVGGSRCGRCRWMVKSVESSNSMVWPLRGSSSRHKLCLGGERGGAGARSRDHHEEVSRWGRMDVAVRKTWRAGRLGSMTSQLGVTGDVAWRSRGDGEVGEDDGLDGGEDLEKLEKRRRARGIRWGPVKAPALDRGCLGETLAL